MHRIDEEEFRRPLDEDMLELDKLEFTEKMNYKVKIPKLIVKLSNTYYSKLSVIAKTLFN
jgi:hypothetical protein